MLLYLLDILPPYRRQNKTRCYNLTGICLIIILLISIPLLVYLASIYIDPVKRILNYIVPKSVPDDPYSNYSRFLQMEYQKKSFFDKKTVLSAEIPFVNLTIFEVEEKEIPDSSPLIQGRVEKIHKKEKLFDIKNVFEPITTESSIEFVLLEGAPGIGKSKFVREMCKRWATNKQAYNLDSFSLVILVNLRDERNVCKLSDLLMTDSNTDMDALILHMNKTYSSNVLWILDGFDELPEKEQNDYDSIYHRLIRRESKYLDILIRDATVLVTSRSIATRSLLGYVRHWKDTSKRLEIIGFDDRGIETFAKYYFKEDQKILTNFSKFYNIGGVHKSLMYTPINTGIICLIYKFSYNKNWAFPRTNTELYSAFTCILILSHLKYRPEQYQNFKCERMMRLSDIDTLPDVIKDNLKIMLYLAYTGINDNQFVFTDLNGLSDNLGFMVEYPSSVLSNTSSSSFIHSTLQEYLAAVYITDNNSLFDVSVLSFIKGFDLAAPFCAGLLDHLHYEETYLLKLLRYVPANSIEVLTCLFEVSSLKNGSISEEKLLDMIHTPDDSGIVIIYPHSPLDHYILGYFIGNFPLKFKIEVTSMHDINFLLDGIKTSQMPKGFLYLTISEIPPSKDKELDNAQILSKIPKHILKELSLYIRDISCFEDSRNVISSFSFLNRLHVVFIDIHIFGEEEAKMGSKLKNLTELSMSLKAPISPSPLLNFIKSVQISDLCLNMGVTNCFPIHELFHLNLFALQSLRITCSNVSKDCHVPINSTLIAHADNVKNSVTIDIDCPYVLDILPFLVNVRDISLFSSSDLAAGKDTELHVHQDYTIQLSKLLMKRNLLQRVNLYFSGSTFSQSIMELVDIMNKSNPSVEVFLHNWTTYNGLMYIMNMQSSMSCIH